MVLHPCDGFRSFDAFIQCHERFQRTSSGRFPTNFAPVKIYLEGKNVVLGLDLDLD